MGRGSSSGRNTVRRLIAESGVSPRRAQSLLRRAGQVSGESGGQAAIDFVRRQLRR